VTPPQPAGHRRGYLDWLRGIGVLIMIEGHTLDSWTRVEERGRSAYQLAIQVAGIGAPLFLFLAGVALALAAGSRTRKGLPRGEVVRMALSRGAWIFALAFLFRLQSWAISGGAFPGSLLKVDILNVMGVSMMAGALIWGAARDARVRALACVGATLAIAMATPVVRGASALSVLPDPVEWYLRPAAGSATFTLFPWSGFLTGGLAVGLWLDALRSPGREARGIALLTGLGLAVAGLGYGASFLPPLYANASFWTTSPTFFFIRLGIVLASTGVAYLATRARGAAPLLEFGRASLFVYWIHVEMVYGVLSFPLHRRLSFEAAVVALVLFSLLLFTLVRVKDRLPWRPRRAAGGLAPARTNAS
jgi:uncharacterized membrane protein